MYNLRTHESFFPYFSPLPSIVLAGGLGGSVLVIELWMGTSSRVPSSSFFSFSFSFSIPYGARVV